MELEQGDHIRMATGLAGSDFSWAPGQVLTVGEDIEAGFANALITPHEEDAPRAYAIDQAEAERLLQQDEQARLEAASNLNEIPPGKQAAQTRSTEQAEEEPVEKRDEKQEMERATAPAAEQRETATPKRSRRKIKPPAEKQKPAPPA
jgi:hypothetical protein